MLISTADSGHGAEVTMFCGPAALRMQAWAAAAVRDSNSAMLAMVATIRLGSRDRFMQWILVAQKFECKRPGRLV